MKEDSLMEAFVEEWKAACLTVKEEGGVMGPVQVLRFKMEAQFPDYSVRTKEFEAWCFGEGRVEFRPVGHDGRAVD